MYRYPRLKLQLLQIQSIIGLLFLLFLLILTGAATAQVDLPTLQPVDPSQANLTSTYSSFNRRTGEMSYNFTLSNTSTSSLPGPVYVELDSITPSGVSVSNADDTTSNATPVFIFSSSDLSPGQSVSKTVLFLNPTRVRFDFTHNVYSTPQADTVAPQISINSPVDGAVLNNTSVIVSGTATDNVQLAGVVVNGVAAVVTGDNYAATISLAEGGNPIVATATDTAGNSASASINVTVILPDVTPPTISITSPANNAVVNNAQLTVAGNAADDVALASVSVNGVSATITGGSYSATINLSEGPNSVTATATDSNGNSASASINVTLETPPGDAQGPTLSIVKPVSGGLVITGQPVIELSYQDPSGVDTNSINISANGTAITASCTLGGSSGTCTPNNALPEGNVTLAVSLADTLGNTTSQQVQFVIDSLPVAVSIDTPIDGLITKNDSVLVSGTVGAGISSVSVNGVNATLGGGGFSVTVALREGKNMLVALATKASGRTGTDSVDVTRDIFAPIVQIDSPRDGFVAVDKLVAVTGKVNDIVNGATNARVFVNGIEATVDVGSFMVMDIPLVNGVNKIEAVATDFAGNVGRHSINVTFKPAVGVRLNVASGNGQNGIIKTQLGQPLVVSVKDNLGNPVAGRAVTFEVTRNSGLISQTAAAAGKRKLQIVTNGSGQSQVFFTLGDTSGEGNNRVNVTALGVTGEVEFCASALTEPVDKILMVMGDNQRGVVGHPLATPLEALVVDKSGNPINGMNVTFNVIKGNGTLNGASSIVRTTGTDGIARVVLKLGTDAGINNNVVNATYEGQPADKLPATFVSSGLLPGNPADTKFSGVVLDNGHTPIPNALVTIPGTSASGTTDNEGQFLLTNVPVGHIHLRIDPTNSPRPETFPPLEFETVTVAGQVNILGQPILLPVIETDAAKVVGGSQDVTLKMPNVPGLELTVFANSATFPDGSKTGVVSISQVHLDKVPMPPPSGTIFMPPAWTIQPAGVKFDPPAKISIPNDGLPAGRVIDIFQFDHTLNQFINVGKGTVTPDAFAIISDPGFGITRAGWGGCGQPQPPTECKGNLCKDTDPDDCVDVSGNKCPPGCTTKNKPDGSSCKVAKKKGFCEKGSCLTCPTSTSVVSTTPIPLSGQFPALKTGVGAVTAIQVAPTSINWNGTTITEALTSKSNTCPASFGDLCATGVTGVSKFIVGTGGSSFGLPFPNKKNVFYDQHTSTAAVSVLHALGINSCESVCIQKYSCDGKVIGTHEIKRVFTRGTISGQPVTILTVTKN